MSQKNATNLLKHSCNQRVLHPQNPAAAVQHKTLCSKLAANIVKRLNDSQIECGICLEKVLSKKEMSQRRFGLMFCDHAFCLNCIRNWRSNAEVDKDTALRTCPICRTTTHFITPSTKWPSTADEKQVIVDAYKAAMAQKDCVNFDFGHGRCPFGTSCFYRHAYRDGTLEEVHLQRAANADGDVKVLAPVKLSSFLEASLTAQRALTRRPRRQQQQQQQQQQETAGSSTSISSHMGGLSTDGAIQQRQQQQQQGSVDVGISSGSREAAASSAVVGSDDQLEQVDAAAAAAAAAMAEDVTELCLYD